MRAYYLANRIKLYGGVALAIAAICICVRFVFVTTSHALRNPDETVTLDSNSHTTTASPPVISSAPMPLADGDLEIIGDHIAEAIVYLNHGRRESALRALDQAQTASRHALTSHPTTDKINERLKLTLRETEQSRVAISRGKIGAAVFALRKLARQLDAGII